MLVESQRQQKLILDQERIESKSKLKALSVKERLDVKLINVPPAKEIVAETIRQISARHLNKYIIIYGTVVRTGKVNSRELRKKFKCKLCEKEFICESDITTFNNFKLPPRCDNPVQKEKKDNPFFKIAQKMQFGKGRGRGGGPPQKQPDSGPQMITENCKSRQFLAIDDAGCAEFADYQEIKLQELFKTLAPGLIPRSLCVILQNTLAEACKPGDDVMLTGVLVQRWANTNPNPGSRPVIDMALVANNVEVLNKRDFQRDNQITAETLNGFKKFWKQTDCISGGKVILNSVCPNIFERSEVKLGLLLSLIGGVAQKCDQSSMKIRGQIHCLMIGEPGTGKSQLLNTVTQLSNRSVKTTGIGSTSAGLTVSAFKDGPDWVLEAGALVLADCGLCTIDEFSIIKPEDRGSVHEAMEQQTISVAKAGIVCKINTRTTVIAATNPIHKQKWDPQLDIEKNSGITSSLLSRFDLIFIMIDDHDTVEDLQKSDYVLKRQCIQFEKQQQEQRKKRWSTDLLSKYIMFVQKVFEPNVSDEAVEILQTYYQFLRQNERISKDRKTVRMLESLIRLSQAHARMYMKNTVSIFDAISVIILMEHTLVSCLFGFDKTPSVFFENEAAYNEARDTVLCALEFDPRKFARREQNQIGKRSRTPSPIKRLQEDNHDLFVDENSNFTTQLQYAAAATLNQTFDLNQSVDNSNTTRNLFNEDSNNSQQQPVTTSQSIPYQPNRNFSALLQQQRQRQAETDTQDSENRNSQNRSVEVRNMTAINNSFGIELSIIEEAGNTEQEQMQSKTPIMTQEEESEIYESCLQGLIDLEAEEGSSGSEQDDGKYCEAELLAALEDEGSGDVCESSGAQQEESFLDSEFIE